MKKKTGLLFVINDFNVGGAEVFILRLGSALKSNYNVYITEINPLNSNAVFKNRFNENGFKFISSKFEFPKFISFLLWKLNVILNVIGLKNSFNFFYNIKSEKYWEKVFKNNNIKIVNSHLIASDKFVLENFSHFKLTSNFKWIVTLHSSYNSSHYMFLEKDKRRFFIEEAREIFSTADGSVCVADLNKEIFKEFQNINSPFKIFLGYDPDEKNENNEKDYSFLKDYFVFSMVARGIEEKGWEIAIEAFIKCLDFNQDIRLVIICPLTDYISTLKNKYSHIDQIIFTDFLKSPVAVLKYSNVGLLPSYYGESLPYSIIECLGNFIPVITSDRGELLDMIKDSKDNYAGYILSNNENGIPSGEDLYQKMMLLLTDNDEYQKCKKNTSLAFDKFDIKTCVNQYLEVFNK